jgi:exosortase
MEANAKRKFRIDALMIAAMIAHVPMGIEYCLRMWRTGHYQFFPFLMVLVAWLIYERVSGLGVRDRTAINYVLLGFNAVLLAAAVLFYSSTVWMMSFLFLVLVLIHDRFGFKGCMASAPAWLLLLFIFPLPSGIDLLLINKLQFLASQLASWALDSAGLLHFREGVVLVTEKKQFFAEEACSGVRSLFSSLAAVSVFGVFVGYPWWRLGFNLVQTTFWVLVGNALRIATVVFVADNWTDTIASGAYHELLGFAVFLLIFGLAMSTDKALSLFSSSTMRLTKTIPSVNPSDGSLEDANDVASKGHPTLNLAMTILLIAVTLFSCRLTFAKFSKEHLRESGFSNSQLATLEIDDLPNEIGGWRRVSFEHKVRNEHSLLAPESFLWKYDKEGIEATISLDSPYYEFHNLNTCYDGLGWITACTHNYRSGSGKAAGDRSKLTMQKKSQRGVVLFSAFDRKGNLVLPNESFFVGSRFGTVVDNIQLAFGMTAAANKSKISDGALPLSQVQLLVTTPDVEQKSDDLETLFGAARNALLKSSRFEK